MPPGLVQTEADPAGIQVGLGLPRFWPNKLTDQLEVQPTSLLVAYPPLCPMAHPTIRHSLMLPRRQALEPRDALMRGASARLASRTFAFCSRYSSSPPCHAARSRRHEPMTLERQAAVKLARAVSLVHLFSCF